MPQVLTKQELFDNLTENVYTNNNNEITALMLKTFNENFIESVYDAIGNVSGGTADLGDLEISGGLRLRSISTPASFIEFSEDLTLSSEGEFYLNAAGGFFLTTPSDAGVGQNYTIQSTHENRPYIFRKNTVGSVDTIHTRFTTSNTNLYAALTVNHTNQVIDFDFQTGTEAGYLKFNSDGASILGQESTRTEVIVGLGSLDFVSSLSADRDAPLSTDAGITFASYNNEGDFIIDFGGNTAQGYAATRKFSIVARDPQVDLFSIEGVNSTSATSIFRTDVQVGDAGTGLKSLDLMGNLKVDGGVVIDVNKDGFFENLESTGTVQATGGFISGTDAGLTTTVTLRGPTDDYQLQFTGGILTKIEVV